MSENDQNCYQHQGEYFLDDEVVAWRIGPGLDRNVTMTSFFTRAPSHTLFHPLARVYREV